MDRLQQELCAAVRPGIPYPDLHAQAKLAIADLLHAVGVIDLAGEEAVARGLTQPFFPHGVGHFLGIQVHDVAGRQKDRSGGTVPPPEHSPFLRTTRRVEKDQVFTIEPGLYFIEMLLRPHRTGALARHFDWPTIDALAPCGGVRVEDDVVVTDDGHRNLTRPWA
jgi:Xaa-Pro dipeptidase